MADSGDIDVLLFSVLRERAGVQRLRVAFEAGMTGADLLDRLESAYPALAPYRTTLRLAVNQCYSEEAVALAPGDEVALITPVSGG